MHPSFRRRGTRSAVAAAAIAALPVEMRPYVVELREHYDQVTAAMRRAASAVSQG